MVFSSSRAFIFYLNNCKHVFNARNIVNNNSKVIASTQTVNKRLYTTESMLTDDMKIYNIGLPKKKVSKSMEMYLKRSQEYNEFMKKEKIDYQIGKRHLANMMGENPDNFSEDAVKEAIEYLFPSGLHEPKARPVMKPPEEMFPPRKAAEFDESGRPFHSMFYTCMPNFYQTLHKISGELHNLNMKEDNLHLRGLRPDKNIKIKLDASNWLTKVELEKYLLESIRDFHYEYFLNTIQRLADHPLAYEAENFIMKFRKLLQGLVDTVSVLPIEYDADGRPYVTVKDCCRKSSRGVVVIRGNGSGKISINGQDITYFDSWMCREQIMKEILCDLISQIVKYVKYSRTVIYFLMSIILSMRKNVALKVSGKVPENIKTIHYIYLIYYSWYYRRAQILDYFISSTLLANQVYHALHSFSMVKRYK